MDLTPRELLLISEQPPVGDWQARAEASRQISQDRHDQQLRQSRKARARFYLGLGIAALLGVFLLGQIGDNAQGQQPNGHPRGAAVNPLPRHTPYRDLIWAAARHEGLPADLIAAQIETESDFDPNAGSSAGAVGLMQLMPEYVQEQTGYTYDQIASSNRLNILAGCKELKSYLRRYDGNLQLSLAAYNAGAGAVARYGGVPPYGETQAYIRLILQRRAKYRR